MARLRKKGMDAVVLIDCPNPVSASVEKMGAFVIPVPVIDMERAGPDEVRRLFDLRARGIKFLLPQHPRSDERYCPLCDAAEYRLGCGKIAGGGVS